jgi:hypothetical protein
MPNVNFKDNITHKFTFLGTNGDGQDYKTTKVDHNNF